MSVKSDKTFKTSKKIYLEWINETYSITLKDIEHEFVQYKVLGNSVLNKQEADMISKKLGLFNRPYTSIRAIAKEQGMSTSKASSVINDVYLKISIKKQVNKIKL